MKIQCDVCGKEAAAVFCTADEAALCQNCDNRVHNANKLASKHPRFSLLNPQIKESPRKKHNRFLLTGVKLSAAASSYLAVTSSSGSQSKTEIKTSVANEVHNQSNCSETTSNPMRGNESSLPAAGAQASDSTSSISEYLMETLPGWHVEDLLDPSSHYGFCKIDEQVSSFSDEKSRCTSHFLIERHAYMFTSYTSSSSNPNEVERIWDKDGFDITEVRSQSINILRQF